MLDSPEPALLSDPPAGPWGLWKGLWGGLRASGVLCEDSRWEDSSKVEFFIHILQTFQFFKKPERTDVLFNESLQVNGLQISIIQCMAKVNILRNGLLFYIYATKYAVYFTGGMKIYPVMNHTSLCQSKQQQLQATLWKNRLGFCFFSALGSSDYVTSMFVFSSNLCFIKNGSIRLILFRKCMFIDGVAEPRFYPKEKFLLWMFYEFKRKQHENLNVSKSFCILSNVVSFFLPVLTFCNVPQSCNIQICSGGS